MIDFKSKLTPEQQERATKRREDIRSRSVKIKGFIAGRECELLVGHERRDNDKQVYGLMDEVYGITHRCYYFDDEFVATVMKYPDHEFWWFDAGNSCNEIKVTRAELRRSLRELKLI